jgi:regulator of PEP synthase PpsR (kinase-PPPase family)
MTRKFHVHLVSDSTGETIVSVARACLVQFEHCEPTEHVWAMIRTDRQVQKVAAGIEANPGVVLFTMVDEKIRSALIEACSRLGVPCIAVLDPVLEAFGEFLDAKAGHRPGRQHRLDADYFARNADLHLSCQSWAQGRQRAAGTGDRFAGGTRCPCAIRRRRPACRGADQ